MFDDFKEEIDETATDSIEGTEAVDSTTEDAGDTNVSPEPDTENITTETGEMEGDPETFPREYVEKLRKENAGYRDKAKRADGYAQKLHAALVRETGRLADPSDLAFDDNHLEDASSLAEAIENLILSKPHLASRKPMGDIGQGLMSEASETISLAGLLRANAN